MPRKRYPLSHRLFETLLPLFLPSLLRTHSAHGSSLASNSTTPVTSPHDVTLTVVYLASLNSTRNRESKGRAISGAMTYAVSRINARRDLLPGRALQAVVRRTESDALVAIAEMSEQWRRGAVAFFGPEDSCDVEGRVASAWNLPLFAFVSGSLVF